MIVRVRGRRVHRRRRHAPSRDGAVHNFVRRTIPHRFQRSQSRGQRLGPNCNHANKQSNRHKCSSFFHDVANHVTLPFRTHREHCSCFVLMSIPSLALILKKAPGIAIIGRDLSGFCRCGGCLHLQRMRRAAQRDHCWRFCRQIRATRPMPNCSTERLLACRHKICGRRGGGAALTATGGARSCRVAASRIGTRATARLAIQTIRAP